MTKTKDKHIDGRQTDARQTKKMTSRQEVVRQTKDRMTDIQKTDKRQTDQHIGIQTFVRQTDNRHTKDRQTDTAIRQSGIKQTSQLVHFESFEYKQN